jgi:hypothetical protein
MTADVVSPGDQIVGHVSRQLEIDFGERFTHEAIEKQVSESYEAFKDARVQNYLPLLTYRSALARLRAHGDADRLRRRPA